MAKKGFKIHIVHPGMEAEYRALMSGETATSDGRPIRSDLVMITDIIEASSLPAARRLVQAKYPGKNTYVIALD